MNASEAPVSLADVGVVAIGRNEGARLLRCLDSFPMGIRRAVYVDSGSQDDSIAQARRRGAEVVELNLSIPFTAARARNAGFECLLELEPDLSLVQFVDGDCEIVAGWMEAAVRAMHSAPDVVAVSGWRRERYPERTPYNAICDVEWRMGPVGETRSFGGDVLIRVASLREVGGYNPEVIAAEDDELGIRLRRAGGRLIRIDRTSTLHDAAMTRVSQWWNRAKRSGHGYAQVSDLHGAPPERYFVKESRGLWAWTAGISGLAAGLALPTLGLSFWLFGAYPLQMYRIYTRTRAQGFDARESALWGVSCMAAKLPQVVGYAKYHVDKLRSRRPTLIEYKRHGD